MRLVCLIGAVVLVVPLASRSLGTATECFCDSWNPRQKDAPRVCSASCCALNHTQVCLPPPSPNPETLVNFVNVNGSYEVGALRGYNQTQLQVQLNATGSRGWVIHLSGGGWGAPKNNTGSDELNDDGVKSGLGGVGPYSGCYKHCDGILSNDPVQNPMFCEYNKAFLPENDGSSYTANLENPVPGMSGKPHYFRGARILSATIAFFLRDYDMKSATDVILTGTSSGGMGVYLNCDRVADQIHAANPEIRVSCLADAGMFLDYPTRTGFFRDAFYSWNSSGALNQDCIAHYTALGTPWKCILSQYAAPFIKTPLFIAQTAFDSYQMHYFLQVFGCWSYGNEPYGPNCRPETLDKINEYGAWMRGNVTTALAGQSAPRGAFVPACSAHGQTTENEHPAGLWNWPARWSIGDATPMSAFEAWYHRKEAGSYVIEDGTLQSNSKCLVMT